MTAATLDLIRKSATGIDRAWLVSIIIVAMLALADAAQVMPTLRFTAEQLLNTAPYVLFAVLTVAYLKASGAEAIVARAFKTLCFPGMAKATRPSSSPRQRTVKEVLPSACSMSTARMSA